MLFMCRWWGGSHGLRSVCEPAVSSVCGLSLLVRMCVSVENARKD